MNIMTKRGSQDNVVTYEHYCDTKADLNNIPQDKITLGSVAIVLKDENDAMGIYIANSNKEWISFSTGGSGGENSMSDISLSNLLDISLTNPAEGQTLVYNGESGKWENKTNESNENNGGVMTITTSFHHDEVGGTEYYTMDKNFDEIANFAAQGGFVQIRFTESENGISDAINVPLTSIHRGYGPDGTTRTISLNFTGVTGIGTGLNGGHTLAITSASANSFENENLFVIKQLTACTIYDR